VGCYWKWETRERRIKKRKANFREQGTNLSNKRPDRKREPTSSGKIQLRRVTLKARSGLQAANQVRHSHRVCRLGFPYRFGYDRSREKNKNQSSPFVPVACGEDPATSGGANRQHLGNPDRDLGLEVRPHSDSRGYETFRDLKTRGGGRKMCMSVTEQVA